LVLADPGAGTFAGHGVTFGTVRRAQRPDRGDRAFGIDVHTEALGEPQIILRQGVLGVVAAAQQARPAFDTTRPRRTGTVEKRIGVNDAGFAEVDADGDGPEGVGDT
jgi:hypothetical protein